LADLNTEIYEIKMQQVLLESGANSQTEISEHKLIKELHSKWIMIAGEGIVFLSLLIWGIVKTHRSFKKEIELARNQKNFLLSITHEIKSPLAAIKLNLETMRKHDLDASKKAAIIQAAIEETNRMNDMMDNALAAARIDTHSFSLSKENINVSELIRKTLKNKMLHEKDHRIVLEVDDNIFAHLDQIACSSIILNLVENAQKYSEGSITIRLREKIDNILIEVLDEGSGVPKEERELVFQKFYRVGNEETRNSKGTGLGLFIVKHLVQFHNGTINIIDNKPKGSLFRIELPKNES